MPEKPAEFRLGNGNGKPSTKSKGEPVWDKLKDLAPIGERLFRSDEAVVRIIAVVCVAAALWMCYDQLQQGGANYAEIDGRLDLIEQRLQRIEMFAIGSPPIYVDRAQHNQQNATQNEYKRVRELTGE